jgi:integrase/recombinase XerD
VDRLCHRFGLVGEHCLWLKEQKGASFSTRRRYAFFAGALVDEIGEDPLQYSPQAIRQFVIGITRGRSPAVARKTFTAVRSFLRFLEGRELAAPGLAYALPRLVTYSLQPLPRYLAPEEVGRILDLGWRDRALTLRNRAILLLLARLGLRAGEVAGLSLGDIDWRHGHLRVCGKSAREICLPLLQEVGDAILAYVKEGRPSLATDRVFLQHRPPVEPFRDGAAVSSIARWALGRAGVKTPAPGAHVFRHTAATRMLRDGASLESIAAILGHKSVTTTAIYAKVDTRLLSQVVEPWPEVIPC